ncbi:MAG TPA: hypothetical protein H9881_11130 [Candidatus Stackebrandtia excrementipullorum]|nr:hypothetical protein [Candidatus Stackebrandtia excrementipullorum]
MRHIASLFAGILIAPLAWLLIGAAQIGLNPGAFESGGEAPGRIIAVAMFAAAGVLLGLLAASRLSPAGPVVAGLTYVVGFALFRGDMAALHLPEALVSNLLPRDSLMVAGDTGMIVVIGAVLLSTALFPSRWRGRKAEEEAERVDLDTASLAGTTPTTGEATESAAPLGDSGSTRQLDQPTVGDGYDERPPNPFDTPDQPYQAPVPQQRSPYAADGYGQDEYDYDAGRAAGAQQRYSDQHYGGYR